ncbi:NACHT domain-containing protein [Archangium violaceum]|uniref:pentapeptide repeat-containing protein n=1 Tax=Archangium violaceum TaxID=83451 RepID=UPI002B2EA030|nr:NACHT domain-containing protein [Archangium violaceum]
MVDSKNDVSPVSAVLDTAPAKLASALFGDVVSLVGALKEGYSAVRGWMSERRNLRASSGDADATVGLLLATEQTTQTDDVPLAARRQVLLIVGAFAEAWGRCRAYGFSDPDIELSAIQNEFAARMQEHWTAAIAADHPNVTKQERYLRRLVGEPRRTPWYEALWRTLTDAAWDPPLLMPNRRRNFEQFFRLAYCTALASHDGEEVRRYLDGLQVQRADAIRQLLVQDIAGWGARHVFGNVSHHEQLPDMPLAEMYVEPSAIRTNVTRDKRTARPVLGLLRELLRQHPVVVIQADMGLGKSLTARHLALDLAQEYLDSAAPGPTCFFPVFIRCSDDLDAATVENFDLVARRALHRQARQNLALDLAAQDPAFSLPTDQRVLFIVDGFDEVVLGASVQERMFEHLARMTSGDWRCVVLSRPLVLPRSKIAKLDIPVIELQPLSTDGVASQANEWLARWNSLVRVPQQKASLSLEEIAARSLIDLAQTPILLFMIAFTWDDLAGGGVPRVALYETFFRQIARGKHELDVRAEHGRVLEASKRLIEALLEQGIIDSQSEPRDAMLWLMSRAAWKAHCLSREEPLYKHHIEMLVRDELGLRVERDAVQMICGGLLLALQSDPEGEDHALLFGHKSFREYLVGRFWATQLRRILSAKSREKRAKWTHVLLEGELLQDQEERAIDFLIEIIKYPNDAPGVLAGYDEREREKLIEWANEEFNDESQAFRDGESPSIENDFRAPLREAALAIGSLIAGSGIQAEHPRTLRSLIAWCWLREVVVIVHGRGLRHKEAQLSNVDLSNADLSGADFSSADFSDADLSGADLSRAALSGASFYRAILSRTNLFRANLSSADLSGAILSGAILSGAILSGADLSDSDLSDADLSGADLSRTNLSGAALSRANLSGARFYRTDLSEVVVASPNAELRAFYSPNTRWPEGFDPEAAGALLIKGGGIVRVD